MLKSKIDNLPKQDVYDILSAVAKESFFIFDNLYLQTDDVAMGSPVGPALAKAFLCHCEIRMIHNFVVIHFKHGTSN